MQTIIQLIETRWTKASQGAPAAQRRNATPHVMGLPTSDLEDPFLLHHVTFDERTHFARPTDRLVRFSSHDSGSMRLKVTPSNPGVHIEFFGTPFTATSGRPTHVFDLSPNHWAQLICNGRVPEEWGWCYRQYVFNIVHASRFNAHAIMVSTPPMTRIDATVHLW